MKVEPSKRRKELYLLAAGTCSISTFPVLGGRIADGPCALSVGRYHSTLPTIRSFWGKGFCGAPLNSMRVPTGAEENPVDRL